jgi:addiction module RelE/StbE family toxin
MAEVVWLAQALDDLDAIAEYIVADSTRYAAAVVERFLTAAQDLAQFPRMGPSVPEWNDPSYRQRIIYSYRLIYRLREDRAEILAVIHGARLLPDDLRLRQ